VESDFSVFHRCDDPYALPAPVFAARLGQLMHYRGAVRGRALAELESRQSDPAGAPGRGEQPVGLPPGTQWIPGDAAKAGDFVGVVKRVG
jgi:hypothetical protein